MSLSNFLIKKIIDHLTGILPYDPPPFFLGLSKDDPGADGQGINEPSGNAYARVSLNAIFAEATLASSVVKALSNAIVSFPPATGDWGTIQYVAIFDAATDGNVLWSVALSNGIAIKNGDTFSIPIGSMSLGLI